MTKEQKSKVIRVPIEVVDRLDREVEKRGLSRGEVLDLALAALDAVPADMRSTAAKPIPASVEAWRASRRPIPKGAKK